MSTSAVACNELPPCPRAPKPDRELLWYCNRVDMLYETVDEVSKLLRWLRERPLLYDGPVSQDFFGPYESWVVNVDELYNQIRHSHDINVFAQLREEQQRLKLLRVEHRHRRAWLRLDQATYTHFMTRCRALQAQLSDILRCEILPWQNNYYALRDFCREIEETHGSAGSRSPALADSVPCVL